MCCLKIMADEKPSEASKIASIIAACFMIIVNLVILVSCAMVFVFILWMVASPDSLLHAIKAAGGRTLTPGVSNTAAFLVTGRLVFLVFRVRKALLDPESFSIHSGVAVGAVVIAIFFVAFMGVYGALSRSKMMLFMYSTLVILLLFLEYALIYYFTSDLIKKGLREEDGHWTHYTRLAFQCCDFNTSQYGNAAVPPWSCCGTDFYPDNCTVPDSFTKDCVPTIQHWVERYKVVIYVSLTVLHVMLMSCSLLWRSHRASRSHS